MQSKRWKPQIENQNMNADSRSEATIAKVRKKGGGDVDGAQGVA